MKKYFMTALVACAAMFSLNSCKNSAETAVAAIEELADDLSGDNLSEDDIVKAFENAADSMNKAAEKAQSDPEQAAKDAEKLESEGSEAGKKLAKAMLKVGTGKYASSEKVEKAAGKFFEAMTKYGKAVKKGK